MALLAENCFACQTHPGNCRLGRLLEQPLARLVQLRTLTRRLSETSCRLAWVFRPRFASPPHASPQRASPPPSRLYAQQYYDLASHMPVVQGKGEGVHQSSWQESI